jgi:Holliday junction resolvase RusA-like endonuclease
MITIRVVGLPAPQGSKNVSRSGRVYEASRALRPWRALIAANVHNAMRREGVDMMTGPVELRAVFMLPSPKRPRHREPIVRPDLDKLVRALCDGLTDGGAIRDDALIVNLTAVKVYGERPGVWIVLKDG